MSKMAIEQVCIMAGVIDGRGRVHPGPLRASQLILPVIRITNVSYRRKESH
jgi:hypothetical protein